jgi:hypothetical protein
MMSWLRRKSAKVGNSIAWLKSDVVKLKEEVQRLKQENDKLRADLTVVQDRYKVTLNFFEYRVDQIYQGIMSRLSRVLNEHGLVMPPSVPQPLSSDGLSQSLLKPIPEWRDKIIASRSRFLTLGILHSPLTLYGFRLNTSRAIDRLQYIEIMSGDTGIALFGPYKKLPTGDYEATFLFSAGANTNAGPKLAIDVFNATSDLSVASRDVDSFGPATLRFQWPNQFANDLLELRVHQRGDTLIHLKSIEINRVEKEDQGESAPVASTTAA